jgi:hypothetical protein
MFMKKLLIGLLILLLQGCVTPYQRNGFGGGFSEMALANDAYMITFRGNGFTSAELVNAYLLRRGAELTKQKGYKYFIIMTGKQDVDRQQMSTPATINTTGFGSSNYYGNQYGNNFYLNGNHNFNAQTTINPGNTYNVERYKSSMVIRMLKNNKKIKSAFDADIILSNFKES